MPVKRGSASAPGAPLLPMLYIVWYHLAGCLLLVQIFKKIFLLYQIYFAKYFDN